MDAELVLGEKLKGIRNEVLAEEVIAFELDQAPDNRLSNQIAKRRARELLEENFFGD